MKSDIYCLYTHTYICFIWIVTGFVTIVALSILNVAGISELLLRVKCTVKEEVHRGCFMPKAWNEMKL